MENALEIPEFPVRLPRGVQAHAERAKRLHDDLYRLDEIALHSKLQELGEVPSPLCCMLRIRFWDEWNRAEGKEMDTSNIWKGICTRDSWEHIIKDPYSMIWILCPVSDYLTKCDEQIHTLIGNLRNVARVNPVDENGKVNTHVAKIQLQMLIYFDARKNGAIVQRIEERRLSLNANVTAPAQQVLPTPEEAKLIQSMTTAELEELARK